VAKLAANDVLRQYVQDRLGEHPAPIMHRPEPAPGQRRRQRLRQPNPVGQQP
jgi:hypothetical protein